jgi:hypothetical protein
MVMDGMTKHFSKSSGNCPNREGLEMAEIRAIEGKLGVYKEKKLT